MDISRLQRSDHIHNGLEGIFADIKSSGVTAFFWNAIFSAGGLINKILYLLGLPLINWKTSAVAIVIPVVLFLWKNTGLITAIMLIGYSRIPRQYYEIAAGEGATPRLFPYVTRKI